MSSPTKIRGDEATIAIEGAPPRSEAAISTPTPSGQQVLAGRYELLGLLGVGGMGSVYRARDKELDEVVALKVLRRELLDTPTMLDRFRQEAKLARRVTHKNVARTFDIGVHDGEKFLTMEYIDGESLGAKLSREGAMPMKDVVDVASAVCAGLGAAHAAGVVHRDLKPDNILLARDGRVAITDFGIARAVCDAREIGLTKGAPLGTPAYMAPEQVEGKREIDARADIYALGAILFEMMTGHMAWCGDSVYAIAAQRLVNPPPDPRERRADLADAACDLVVRCMARRPEDRFASVEEVASGLSMLTLTRVRAAVKAPPVLPRADVEGEGKTVAVLPFRHKGDDEYVADGLTDDLIDALSMSRGLKVRSRGAVMRFKGIERDARDIGRELDVQVVVDGSVRRVGDRLRVSARLVSVADGFQLWAKRFECSEVELLRVGDEAANAIAQALTVARSAPLRKAPTDPVAIDLYLRARHAYHEGWVHNIGEVLRLFKEALARAPDDPMILAGYALAQLRVFGANPDGADDAGEVGREAAERALALSPHLGEARCALASYRMNLGDYVGAAKDAREALRVAPGSADAHDTFGRLLIEVGRPEEGRASLRAAVMLEPSLFRARADAVRVSALLGDYSECDAFVASTPEGENNLNTFWFYCSRLANWRGDRAWSESLLARLVQTEFPMRPTIEAFMLAGIRKELSPELQATTRAWGKVNSRVKRRPLFFRQLATEVAAYTNDDAMFFSSLQGAADLGLIDLVWLDLCPLFAQKRKDPRFVAVRAVVAERAAEVLEALVG